MEIVLIGSIGFLLIAVITALITRPFADLGERLATEKFFHDLWKNEKRLHTSKVCENCGQEFYDFVEYCPKCNLAVKRISEIEAEKSLHTQDNNPITTGPYYLILPNSDGQRETFQPVIKVSTFLDDQKDMEDMAQVSTESGQVFVVKESRLIESAEGTLDRLVKLRKDDQYYSLGFLKVGLLVAVANMGYMMLWEDLRKKAIHLLEGGSVETDADEAIIRVIGRVQALDMPLGCWVEYSVCTPDGVLDHKSCQLYQERCTAWLQNPIPPFPAYTIELAHAHRDQYIKENTDHAEKVWIRRTVTEKANEPTEKQGEKESGKLEKKL